MNKLKASILLQLVLFSHFLYAQVKVEISSDFECFVLGTELSIFEDVSGEMSFRQVQQKNFRQIDKARPNLGFTNGSFWLKTIVQNKSNETSLKLLINEPQLDSVTLYVVDGSGEIIQEVSTGQAWALRDRPIKDRNFIFDLRMPTNQVREIFFKVRSRDQITVPIYIGTQKGLWYLLRKVEFLLGAYFGLMVVMALYNLFVYISVRDKSYLLYVFYIFILGLTQATLEGYTQFYIWPNNPWFALHSVYVFTCLVSVSAIIFITNFLKTKIYVPRIHRLRNFFFFYFAIILSLCFIIVHPALHIAAQTGISLVAVYMFVTSTLVYVRGYAPAKYFLAAWIVLIIGIIVYAMKDAGLLPANPVTNYMLMAGSAIEAVLLSFALADRINTMKRETEKSQAEALRVAMENEQLVLEQNTNLERKVQERTQVLSETNGQLNTTLSELKNAQSQLVDAEKMASLGQLTAGVAHEINNPINFVSGNIEPLRLDVEDVLNILNMYEGIREADDFEKVKSQIELQKEKIDYSYVISEISQLLNGIQDGADRTAEIVKGLKNFSRLDESSLKYVNLNEGITSTLTILKSKVPDHVSIKLNLGDLPEVECFGGKINQVFMNVINNALQAMESSVDVNQILQIASHQEGDDVVFIFEDSGVGISEDAKAKIFEPFFTTKEVGKGTGLGLSISFNIVETHGGKITFESEQNHGSTFTLRLPIVSPIESELD